MFNWLKNPRRFSPHATMPSLRLSDWEARSIVTYILSLSKPLAVDAALRAKVAEAATIDRGKTLLSKRGCYGCHDIAGFENGERIGPELTTFGNKEPFELAFGTTLDKDAKVHVEES